MADGLAKPHEVVLLGKKYKLRSSHDDAYLAELASQVQEAVTDAQRRGTVSTLDAALLTALNLADELARVKKDAEDRLSAIGEKVQELLSRLEGADPWGSGGEAPGDREAVGPPRKADAGG